MQDALNIFAEENGMTITFVGARDFEEQINSQVAGGNPPDIAIFPQPGKLPRLRRERRPVPAARGRAGLRRRRTGTRTGSAFWQTEDGTQFGVPVKSDLKSLVWYSPAAFAEKGYEVPETLDDFFALDRGR